jgi:hypothetical protein
MTSGNPQHGVRRLLYPVCMANCVQCGRELPSFSVGELNDKCVECQVRERIARDRQAKANRPGTSQLARMFPVTAGIVVLNVLVYIGERILGRLRSADSSGASLPACSFTAA